MPTTPWFRRRPGELQREQDLLLKQWITREVIPFSPFWAARLRGVAVTDVASLQVVPVIGEADIASAGGPGNPALLLSPTEDQFKKHAPRGELLTAARQAAGRGATSRRQAIWRRYKAVHVHEAGVDRLLAIAYTRADLDRLHLAGGRLAEVMGWGAEDALLNLVPSGPSVRFWGLYHAALANRMTALHPRGAGQSAMGPARRGLALLPASIIAVPTDEAESVLEGLVGQGVTAPNLRMLAPVGPPPSAAVRIRLTDLGERLAGNPVRVQAVWAPEMSRVLYGESPVAANDPPEATYGLMTYPDLELLEVRDVDSGSIVEDGPGELVLTSLGWRGTALVRVATGAWVGGLEQRAPQPVTGATVPRIAPQAADGAWQPRVLTGDGKRRVDLRGAGRVITPALSRLGITDWSLTVVDQRLVLCADAPTGTDRTALEELAAKVGEAGVRPQLITGPVAPPQRSRVGHAGPPLA
ncbi:hypothetical protein BH23ACT9_BH23ACT9_32940 [soil metagenome]